ncbi:hypothetical protein NE237_032750 [Protea cynaroides]|uniref:Pollen Ole e 1 allergen and extensin family protein n=1 Tax=Protea cynaroides TaxID=273540 RepID=A0A9Q0R3D3_9MAGN|nr:hypothetical protein NE237_032750 [Protea cynaroides]
MNSSKGHGCFSILIFIFIITVKLRSSTARPEKESPFVELFTHAELVETAGYGEAKLSSVLVTGEVLCNGRMDGDDEPHATPVSGAKVAVTCKSKTQKMKKPDTTEALTDEYGDFMIDLPSHLHAIPNLEKECFLKVLSQPEHSPCNRAIIRKPQGLRLASIGNGIRTYTTGTITLYQPHQTSNLGGQSWRNEPLERLWN